MAGFCMAMVPLAFRIAFPNCSILPFLQPVQAALPGGVLLGRSAGRERKKKPGGITIFAHLELAARVLKASTKPPEAALNAPSERALNAP